MQTAAEQKIAAVPPFPYKKEFIDPEVLWNNAVTLDLVPLEPVILPSDLSGWSPLPVGVKWQYQGKCIGFITGNDCYNRVNKLVDYFSEPARMKASRKGHPSPEAFYETHYPEILERAERDLEKHNRGQSDYPSEHGNDIRYWIREEIYLMNKECTTFKITVTKAILKFLGSKIVLDPSAGWGDRLLGAAAAGVKVYHGVDPNPNLREAYDEMISFLKTKVSQTEIEVVTEDFLQLGIDEGTYDTVFTSPPYYDYEIYSDDSRQSVHGRSNLQKWIANFLHPYLRKAWSALMKGGHMALYISDVKGARFVKSMLDFVRRELKGNYLGVIAMTNRERTYGYPIWVWRK